MSWIVGVGLGSLGPGGADVLDAVVPASDAHPAKATESATAIQPCFIPATVYLDCGHGCVGRHNRTVLLPISYRSAPGFTPRQTFAHACTSYRPDEAYEWLKLGQPAGR
jgi:hypothetical protein